MRKEQKNAKHSILKSVVGTLDLNIRYLLQGETYPGVFRILSHFVALSTWLMVLMHCATWSFLQERVKAPIFCCINRTPPNRYGYIANLCVIKSARRQGIASNMLSFAIGAAKSNGNTTKHFSESSFHLSDLIHKIWLKVHNSRIHLAGVTQVYVHVDKNNSPAQILYQKMGFEVILLVCVHFSPSTLDRISH